MWPLTVTPMRRLVATNHRCQRRIFDVFRKGRVTNEEVRARIEQERLENILRLKDFAGLDTFYGGITSVVHNKACLYREITGTVEEQVEQEHTGEAQPGNTCRRSVTFKII